MNYTFERITSPRTTVTRKYPVIGQVKDVDGVLWNVRDVRNTKHGFNLQFGTPAHDHGAYRGGLPRLIATPALWDFWDTNCLEGHGFLFDLPAGRTTLKRLRRRLGFNFDEDWNHFWQDRLHDLAAMTPREFAAKHMITPERASDHRKKRIGRTARPLGWWRTSETIEILLSGMLLREIASELGIGTSQAFRLRQQAEDAYPNFGTVLDSVKKVA